MIVNFLLKTTYSLFSGMHECICIFLFLQCFFMDAFGSVLVHIHLDIIDVLVCSVGCDLSMLPTLLYLPLMTQFVAF